MISFAPKEPPPENPPASATSNADRRDASGHQSPGSKYRPRARVHGSGRNSDGRRYIYHPRYDRIRPFPRSHRSTDRKTDESVEEVVDKEIDKPQTETSVLPDKKIDGSSRRRPANRKPYYNSTTRSVDDRKVGRMLESQAGPGSRYSDKRDVKVLDVSSDSLSGPKSRHRETLPNDDSNRVLRGAEEEENGQLVESGNTSQPGRRPRRPRKNWPRKNASGTTLEMQTTNAEDGEITTACSDISKSPRKCDNTDPAAKRVDRKSVDKSGEELPTEPMPKKVHESSVEDKTVSQVVGRRRSDDGSRKYRIDDGTQSRKNGGSIQADGRHRRTPRNDVGKSGNTDSERKDEVVCNDRSQDLCGSVGDQTRDRRKSSEIGQAKNDTQTGRNGTQDHERTFKKSSTMQGQEPEGDGGGQGMDRSTAAEDRRRHDKQRDGLHSRRGVDGETFARQSNYRINSDGVSERSERRDDDTRRQSGRSGRVRHGNSAQNKESFGAHGVSSAKGRRSPTRRPR